jgi:hypothetical protein
MQLARIDISPAGDHAYPPRAGWNPVLYHGRDRHGSGRLDDDFHPQQQEPDRVQDFRIVHQYDVVY